MLLPLARTSGSSRNWRRRANCYRRCGITTDRQRGTDKSGLEFKLSGLLGFVANHCGTVRCCLTVRVAMVYLGIGHYQCFGGFLTARAILFLSAISSFFLAMLLASWALSQYLDRHPRFAPWAAVGGAGAMFMVTWILYCELLYPALSPALGGGKLEAITVWIAAEHFSDDARKQLPANSCAVTAKLIRCDHVNSVPMGESYFVIIAEHSPALVLQGRSVKALAMSTEP